jgi:hypothetical protein
MYYIIFIFLSFSVKIARRFGTKSEFETKLITITEFAKHTKYKQTSLSSQVLKSVVVAFMRRFYILIIYFYL